MGKKDLFEKSIYENIRITVVEAQRKVYATVNFVMVETYWNIGKQICEAQGENESAEYGKGYTVTNLKYMCQFYMIFPNCHALRDQLSWTHYRMLLKVENDAARNFYLDECVKANWSTKQLERQINSFYYQRLLSSKDKESV